jgi:hypothetical protein
MPSTGSPASNTAYIVFVLGSPNPQLFHPGQRPTQQPGLYRFTIVDVAVINKPS